jgi:hypothetical protein
MPGSRGSNMPVMTAAVMTRPLKMAPIRRLPMTGMSFGNDRRELNGDQQDHRPKHPQKRAGRSHAQLLPCSSSQRDHKLSMR